MAQRRMFSKSITRTDKFLDMPQSAQNLYFHLGIEADDDGFVSPKMIMRTLGSMDDDLSVLILKGFVIPFESGVLVITHWKENNYIQSDRYKPTIYQKELEELGWIGNVYKLDTQVRLGKVRLGKESSQERVFENKNLLKERKPTPEDFRDFEKFWSVYPRQERKPRALEEWCKISPSPELINKIVEAVSAQKNTEQWQEERYIPHPHTWLAEKRWEEEIKTQLADVKKY